MAKNNKQTTNQRNSLGMDRMVYKQLLKKLDQGAQSEDTQVSPNRYHTRLEYHQPYLDLDVQTADHARRTITVAARNISRGGLSVLHSSFTYPGTSVRTKLDRINGNPLAITGSVVRCEHRGGVVHEIGIKFENELIVQEFIQPDIIDCVRTYERTDPETISGRALFVGDEPMIVPLLREYLQQTCINFGFEKTAKDAFDKGLAEHDLIVCCMNAGDMTGPEFARATRAAKYYKPVILIGSSPDESTRNQIRLSSADCFIPAPINENDCLCAIADYLLTPWDTSILNAVRMHNSSQTRGSLLTELAKLGIILDQHLRTADAVQIFATCNKIKSIAPLLGFDALRDKAVEIGELIASTGEPAPHTQGLHEIITMCTDKASAA